MTPRKKTWLGAGFAFVNVAVLAWVFFSEDDLATGLSAFTSLQLPWVAAGLALVAAYLLFAAVGLYFAARGCGADVGLRAMIRAELCSRFYTMITPLGAGGQPMYVFQLTRSGLASAQATAAVSARYVGYQTAYLSLCLMSACAVWRSLAVWVRLGVLVSLGSNIGLLAFVLLITVAPRPLHAMARAAVRFLHFIRVSRDPEALEAELYHGVKLYAESFRLAGKGTIACVFAAAALQTTCLALFAPCLYMALGLTGQPLAQVAALGLVAMSAVMLVPTPGNAGGAEGAFYAVTRGVFPTGVRLTAMLAWRTLSYYLPLVVTGLTLAAASVAAGAARRRSSRLEEPLSGKNEEEKER